jgi:hypothetical protein
VRNIIPSIYRPFALFNEARVVILSKRWTLGTAIVAALAVATSLPAQSNLRVRVQTELGDIVVELDAKRAPVTTANFLKYVDAGHYDGGTFHRTVKMDTSLKAL